MDQARFPGPRATAGTSGQQAVQRPTFPRVASSAPGEAAGAPEAATPRSHGCEVAAASRGPRPGPSEWGSRELSLGSRFTYTPAGGATRGRPWVLNRFGSQEMSLRLCRRGRVLQARGPSPGCAVGLTATVLTADAPVSQKLRQDLRELQASSVELLGSCRDQQQACLSEILAAARGAQRHLEALPCKGHPPALSGCCPGPVGGGSADLAGRRPVPIRPCSSPVVVLVS